MPKKRGASTSPATASPKKSKVPITPSKAEAPPSPVEASAITDNGNHDDTRLIMEDLGDDRIVIETETASTSSGEDCAVDQVSDEDAMDSSETTKEALKNGDGSPEKLSLVFDDKPDWAGYLAAKHAFFEKLQLLQSENCDAKIIVDGCKEILATHFPNEEPAEKRLILDQALREYLVENLMTKAECWKSFLDFVITMSREEMCSPTAPITLLTDLVELSSLDDCSLVFDFIESRLEIWKQPLFFTAGKNAVLRMCNDLLRRQSRAQNTVFCGRVLIFLSNYFPFSERSGLNIISEFNLDNVTSFKKGDGSDDPEDQIEIAESSDDKLFEGIDISIPGLDKIVSITQEEKKKKIKVDHNLYVKFWSLQDCFRNPNSCYNKIQWKTFTMYTNDVLGAFNSFKLDEASHRKRIERSDDNLPSINPIPKLGDENLYFAKYLTNRRLLELQMSDPSFRRYFLLQLLVILQYLTTPAKNKSDDLVLNDDQADFVKKTTEKVYELLSEIPPDGLAFVKCVKHVLQREELWNKWKNSGCHPFSKPVPPASLATSTNSGKEESSEKKIADGLTTPSDVEKEKPKKKKPRRRIGDSVKEAVEKNRVLLGHAELTRLWNICPDNLEACRKDARNFIPQMDIFFAEAFNEIEAEPTPLNALIDPKKEPKPRKILGDLMYGWKALRLLARRSPYFFQMFGGGPISPLQNYLEYVLKKIKAEKEPVPSQEDAQTPTRKVNDSKSSADAQPSQDNENTADGEQVMEVGTAEDDETLRPEETNESGDEEEGEVTDKMVRPLTEDEQKALAKGLGKNWQKLAAKLGFKADEIQYFNDENKDNAAFAMLKNWQDQDEDANAADLIYKLEGLKMKDLAMEVFKQ